MRQEYNKLFDKITSERSDKELLEGAIRKAENMKQKRKFNKKAVIVPVAAAITLALGGVGVGAAFGFDHLTNMFGANEALVSEIQSNVFEDSDGHVKVTVEQLLSDGRYVHAAVHYEALDERGISWLASEPFGTELNSSHSILHIKCDDAYCSGVASYGSIEAEELRTETDRYFYLHSQIDTGTWSGSEFLGSINYPLTSKNKTASLELDSFIETRRFNIVGEERSSKYLTPLYIDISHLSYCLYAQDDYGLVERTDFPEGGYSESMTVSFEEAQEEIWDKGAVLICADGERIELGNFTSGPNDDCWTWMSGEIINKDAVSNCWTADYSIEFDFDELVGLEIDGVYYDLVAE